MTVNNEGWGAFKTNKWLFTTPSSSFGRPVSSSRVTQVEEKAPETPTAIRANRPRTLSDRGNEILDRHEAVEKLYAWRWADVKENYQEKGIHNPSIYCYAISTIQLLSHIPAIVRLLQEHRCSDPICLACNWKRYFFNHPSHAGNIAWFREAFKKNKKFNHGRQEDAHDALLAVIGKLEKVAKQNPRLKDRTLDDDLFGYTVRNEVQCRLCKHKHVYYENNTVMTVRMMKKDPSGRKHTIKEYMQQLFAPSICYDYGCTKCKKKSDAHLRPTLMRAPQTLLLHLSRFSYDGYGRKISRPVHMNETIDVASMATDGHSTVYKFCSSIIHGGATLDYGHYWCVARCRRNETRLVTLNDSVIQYRASVAEIQQSYIALYRRQEHLPVECHGEFSSTATTNGQSMI